jgi:hypothetical protein
MPSVLKPATLFAHSGFYFVSLQIRRAESLVGEKKHGDSLCLSFHNKLSLSLSLSEFSNPGEMKVFDGRFFARHSCCCCCRFLFPLPPCSFSILLLLLLLFFPLVCREEEEGRIGIETQGGRQTKQREAERVSVSLFFFTTR